MSRLIRSPQFLHRIIRQYRIFSTTSVPCDDFSNVIPPNIQSKILYSSFLENQKHKIGYRKQRALAESQEIVKKRALLNRVNVKPFPQSLKSLIPNGNLYDKQAKVESNQQHSKGDGEQHAVCAAEPAKSWMTDYEFYDSDEEEDGANRTGTPDPSIPPSKIPCSGCGAVLHCADTGLPGYIPSEIFRGRTAEELKMIICQRCHFLKDYNIALDVAVSSEDYVKTLQTISTEHALAILIVDLLDFPCSIWPGIQDILGPKRPVFIVGNKVDLLPKDAPGYLNRIKNCLTKAITDAGVDKMNIMHVALISAKTGYGVEELITRLHTIWKYKGDVYLVGCTNVGKSTLFNALLRSDYCKSQATDLIQKATTCPWPGTTLQMLKFPILRPSDIRLFQRHKRLSFERTHRIAEDELRKEQMQLTGKPEKATLIGYIGRTFVDDDDKSDPFSMSRGTSPIVTLNEKDKALMGSKWCYDTPGVVHPDQILNLLNTEEIIHVIPKRIIQPQPFLLKPGMSLFLAGLGRLCFVSGQSAFVRVHVFTSSELPLLVTRINDADAIYAALRGTAYMPVPQKDEVRDRKWPGLESSLPITIMGEVDEGLTCDIVLSSSGWIGIELPIGETCVFRAWTPHRRGIHVRSPALISQANLLRGGRIRGSLAYKRKVCKL